jgi:DNA-binding response OmpR family regulator
MELMDNNKLAGSDRLPGKRVLLVDDERLTREFIGLLLRQDDYTVVEANNGVEALQLFSRSRFDLVLTDFEIPFLKGDELASKIKHVAPLQPILMITGHGKRPGRSNPVDAILNKPIRMDELRSTIAILLHRVQTCDTAPERGAYFRA